MKLNKQATMQKLIATCLFSLLLSSFAVGQIGKNSISGNILGTGSYIGFSYERIVLQRLSLEAGLGLIGYGFGASIYALKPDMNKVAPYLGIKYTTHAIVDGEHKSVYYLPLGLTYFAKFPINIGFDLGPALRIHHSPGYMPTPAELDKYPFTDFGIFGNIKMGIRF